MMILITTLGRCDNQITLNSLEGISSKVSLVVQYHEYDEHAVAYPHLGIIRLPVEISTLGPTRKHLCQMFPRTKIVLLDDDLVFYHRPDPADWHLKPVTPVDLDNMFAEVEDRLGEYAHVSVSAREGNNTVTESWEENTRYMRFLGYNPSLFPSGLEIGRVDGMSDFDLNLQLLRRGWPNCVCFKYAHHHPGTQTPGGCSLNRTHATHEAEIKKMIEWHGPFVKPRQKVNKTGGEFGTRTELTIYWKKAFESSQRKNPRGLSVGS